MNISPYQNKMIVRFLLCGPHFVLGSKESSWSSVGTIEHTKKDLPIDNINLFEAGWGYDEIRYNAKSLDEVVESALARIWTHRKEVRVFARKRHLHCILDCYVDYYETAPLVELSVKTVKRMAALDCSIGLEVVQLPAARKH